MVRLMKSVPGVHREHEVRAEERVVAARLPDHVLGLADAVGVAAIRIRLPCTTSSTPTEVPYAPCTIASGS